MWTRLLFPHSHKAFLCTDESEKEEICCLCITPQSDGVLLKFSTLHGHLFVYRGHQGDHLHRKQTSPENSFCRYHLPSQNSASYVNRYMKR